MSRDDVKNIIKEREREKGVAQVLRLSTDLQYQSS